MGFEQATIAIQKPETFAALKSRIESALERGSIEKFMKAVGAAGFTIRQFERILGAGLLEKSGSALAAVQLYRELSPSDQGQMREFYLTRVEQVPDEIREKFSRIYRYS